MSLYKWLCKACVRCVNKCEILFTDGLGLRDQGALDVRGTESCQPAKTRRGVEGARVDRAADVSAVCHLYSRLGG